MMPKKGQIVEIPASALLYKEQPNTFSTKKEELLHRAAPRRYTLFDGILVGAHEGLDDYQLGQRKKISVGGKPQPLYVIGFDYAENRLFVGAGADHPGLLTEVMAFPADRIFFTSPVTLAQNTEEKIPVEIVFNDGQTEEAHLFLFPDVFFLEFFSPIRKTSVEMPASVFYHKNLFAEIH